MGQRVEAMPRPSGHGWLDRWLRRPINRAVLVVGLLVPTLLLLNTPRLPEMSRSASPEPPVATQSQTLGRHICIVVWWALRNRRGWVGVARLVHSGNSAARTAVLPAWEEAEGDEGRPV